MISDVLVNAIGKIRQCQTDEPEWYDDMKEWIDSVVREMEALRRFLDMSPLLNKKLSAIRHLLYGPDKEQRKWLMEVLSQLEVDGEMRRR